jgi:hypothetical protein
VVVLLVVVGVDVVVDVVENLLLMLCVFIATRKVT